MRRLIFNNFPTLVLLFTLSYMHAQTRPSTGQTVQKQTEIEIDSKLAESMLIHKEEPACQKEHAGVHITGTVVMAIAIDKNGVVSYARVISGPKLLQKLALSTVRKYRYKPYLVNNKPVDVDTVVSIHFDCFFYSGQA